MKPDFAARGPDTALAAHTPVMQQPDSPMKVSGKFARPTLKPTLLSASARRSFSKQAANPMKMTFQVYQAAAL